MSSKMSFKIMYFQIFRTDRFWSHFGTIWGPILVPFWCSWVALGVLWAVWGRPWALKGALGTPLGNPWPLSGLSGGARRAFMGPFLGHTCPHLVAMLNKVAPKRNARAHPAKSSARSKNTLSVHLLSSAIPWGSIVASFWGSIFGLVFDAKKGPKIGRF